MANAGTLEIKVAGVPFPIQFADWTHDRLYHTVEFSGGDTTELQAFIGGIGASIPGGQRSLTLADTNIPRSGDTGVPEGWEMLVYSIQIEIVREMLLNVGGTQFQMQDTVGIQLSRPPHVGGFDPAVAASGGVLFDFMRKSFHEFKVNQKQMSQGTIEKYPQGSGISVFTTNTATEVANNGVPSPRDQSAFVLPIWLRSNVSYFSRLVPTAPLGIGAGPNPPYVGGYIDWSAGTLVGGAGNSAFDVKVTLEGLLKRPVA